MYNLMVFQKHQCILGFVIVKILIKTKPNYKSNNSMHIVYCRPYLLFISYSMVFNLSQKISPT